MQARAIAFVVWALVAATAMFWLLRLFAWSPSAPAHTLAVASTPPPRGDLTRVFGAPPAPKGDPAQAVPTSDLRFGGRVTLEAWVSNQLRMFAAYDLSSAIDAQPEISGYRSLRLIVSGVY